MNKLILILVFFTTQAFASDISISKTTNECVSDPNSIDEKIKSYEKFRKIDDSIWVPTFHKANLIFSELKPEYSTPTQKAIFFSIKPLPMFDMIPKNLQPRFVATCEITTNPKSLTCTQVVNVKPYEQFVIKKFDLKLTFNGDQKCEKSYLSQKVSYTIVIDELQYNQIKTKLSSYGIPESTVNEFADVKTFLGEYWKEFFKAWNDNDWIED